MLDLCVNRDHEGALKGLASLEGRDLAVATALQKVADRGCMDVCLAYVYKEDTGHLAVMTCIRISIIMHVLGRTIDAAFAQQKEYWSDTRPDRVWYFLCFFVTSTRFVAKDTRKVQQLELSIRRRAVMNQYSHNVASTNTHDLLVFTGLASGTEQQPVMSQVWVTESNADDWHMLDGTPLGMQCQDTTVRL